MKKIFYTLCVTSAILFVGCGEKSSKEDAKNLVSKKEIKEKKLILKTIEGKEIEVIKTANGFKFKGYENKIILVDFFATWCPPCKAEIPHLINLQEKYKDNFSIIAILLEENKPQEEIASFVNYYKINYDISSGEGNFDLAEAVGGVKSIPLMIMYDKNGNKLTHYLGAVPEEMIENDILKAIGK